ncbi:MAG: DNA-formamidopyrimidine glycosylase [Thermodesulfobacteria bacterium]|nr:DNA-formamidopyrimidine glycosylase [Thermodesulfobacteriota bacterium]
MPELPEVETIKRTLSKHLPSRQIKGCEIRLPKLVLPAPEEFSRTVVGQKVLELERRGKFLLLHLSGNLSLLCHFRLTGQLIYLPDGQEEPPHTHLRFILDQGNLLYADLRQFGKLELLKREEISRHPSLLKLGPEPWELTPETFCQLLQRSHRQLKALLLDQSVIAGLGNIYVDESLFRAGLHPTRKASSLSPEEAVKLHHIICEVLKEAIATGGSSVRNYVDGEGKSGTFQERHLVYGRRGQPCPRCKTPIAYTTVASRGTHFCPVCQK